MCKTSTNITNDFIHQTLSHISIIQDNLNKILCLQRETGNFMDDVKGMNPISDYDSIVRVQLSSENVSYYVDIVIDYLFKIISITNEVDSLLNKALQVSKQEVIKDE